MVTADQKNAFIKAVNEAKDGYMIFSTGIKDVHLKNFQTIFNILKKDFPLKNEVEFVVEEGLLKDGGEVREGWHDYVGDKITIYVESIYYTFCVYTTKRAPRGGSDDNEWLILLTNTIAHEYYHAIQKSEGIDMSKDNKNLDYEAEKFAQEIIRKFFPEFF